MAEEPGSAGGPTRRLVVSLSGGGYRAMMFAAGSMLAIADSDMRKRVASVSSVSGGSIASAGTIGGLADTEPNDPDPMGRRVGLLAGIARSDVIRAESTLRQAFPHILPGTILILILFLFPLAILLPGTSDPLTIAFVTMGASVAGGVIVSISLAIAHSWYGVQASVETLVAAARRSNNANDGTTLTEIHADDPTDDPDRPSTQRIFCATDLGAGVHAYFTPHRVLVARENHDVATSGSTPNVYLSEVVAASACFPGFRPVVFRPKDLGLATDGQLSGDSKPRRHRFTARFFLGLIGFVGLAAIVVAVVARIFGPLNGTFLVPDEWSIPGTTGRMDIVIAIGIAVAGFLLTLLSAYLLRQRDELVFVDGGVCDNLGAAFTLLVRDERYPGLLDIASANGEGFMLVVDASKPFTVGKPRLFDGLIPLRWRGAQRSLFKLVGSANSDARMRAIRRLVTQTNPPSGAVVSMRDVPREIAAEDASFIDSQLWSDIREATTSTKTTLDSLGTANVWALLFHGYRLTQERLEDHHFVNLYSRSAMDLLQVVEPMIRSEASLAEVLQLIRSDQLADTQEARLRKTLKGVKRRDVRLFAFKGLGPYAKAERLMRAVGVVVALVFPLALMLYLLRLQGLYVWDFFL